MGGVFGMLVVGALALAAVCALVLAVIAFIDWRN